MISWRKMAEEDTAVVRQLGVHEDQNKFVSPIEKILNHLEPHEECHLLEFEKEIVGFFIINENYWQRYNFSEPGEIGLLGFFIDAQHQGKGLGKAGVAALKPYLRACYPAAKAVILTVNCQNQGAISVYWAGGFEDTGQQYLGGRSGPQHIMRMPL